MNNFDEKTNFFDLQGEGLSNIYVVLTGVSQISMFIYKGGGGVKNGQKLVYEVKVCPICNIQFLICCHYNH